MADKIYRRKRRRRAYLDDFQINENGTYEYTGGRYVYQGEDFRPAKIRLGIIAGLMLLSAIMAGCFPAVGINTPLVLIPYAVAAGFAVASCWALIRLVQGGNPMRAYVYQESVLRLPRRALLTAVSSGASLAGELLFVIQNGYWKGLLLAPVFPVCMVITFLTAVLLKTKAEDMKWTEEKREEKTAPSISPPIGK